MQIIVVGAGAIGSLYGAKLARDNDVTLIARAEHASAINAHGLKVEGREPQTVRVRAATHVEQLGRDALVLVTTKVPATAAALSPLAPLIRDDTTIVSLQNGLGSEMRVRDAVGVGGVVLRGITQFGAIYERPGVIRYMVAGHTILEQHERSHGLAQTLNAAGLDCRISPDIAADIWQKLIFNCVVNPITAIIGCEVGGIVSPGLDRLKQLVISECRAVAAAEGIHFETDLLARINEVYAGSRNIVSMLQDLRRGRPTEIDYLNGVVVELASKHGLQAPVNASLATIIKAME
ncbi:MAG: 2-dehydropantoate 2-reductase [Verrucomicrobiaceae bacterium]|nr:2-dehydropantoate 2-reductase [Verrucomicrobiaceae bacterium]